MMTFAAGFVNSAQAKSVAQEKYKPALLLEIRQSQPWYRLIF
jgi:hypothetical protein